MTTAFRVGFLGLVLLYTLSPLAVIFVTSLAPGRTQVVAVENVTFRWYLEALTNPTIQAALFTSLAIAIATALLSVALGFASARLVRKLSPTVGLISMIVISIPALLPTIVSGFSLHAYFQAIGLDGTLLGILSAHVAYASPFAFFLLYVAHTNLNPELEQCACNLGASEHQVAFGVVLPQLGNVCVGAAIICGLISWNEFMITWFVSGFQKTLPTLVYGMMGSTLNPSLYAVGTTITLVSLILMLLSGLAMRKQIISNLARR